VVVTYNRKDLLRECLQALQAQSRPVDEILVVDNASTDGTGEMLEREFDSIRAINLPKNIGGAGGFHEGIRRAYEDGCGWLWLMDDDSIPQPSALEELEASLPILRDLGKKPSLLASKVFWTDGTLHPMNSPTPRWAQRTLFVEALERGYMLIRSASFVSLLLSHDAVTRHGLPYKDFFIWGDDFEYTSRVLYSENGYLVPRSVVVHKTKEKYTPASSTGPRFRHMVRNRVWILKTSSLTRKEKLNLGWRLAVSARKYLKAAPRGKGLWVVLLGLAAGVLSRPNE
jgi:GT2 family glycosyltransferase